MIDISVLSWRLEVEELEIVAVEVESVESVC
jgi:hypothetical protein